MPKKVYKSLQVAPTYRLLSNQKKIVKKANFNQTEEEDKL